MMPKRGRRQKAYQTGGRGGDARRTFPQTSPADEAAQLRGMRVKQLVQAVPVRTKRRSTSQNSWVAVDIGAWP
jgi:hypothetical protein